jgi:hypothetical protein
MSQSVEMRHQDMDAWESLEKIRFEKSINNMAEVLDFYTSSVKSALPPKPPAPSPFPVRAAVAAPSARAVELDRDHFVAVSAAWKELLLLLGGRHRRLLEDRLELRARRDRVRERGHGEHRWQRSLGV